MPTPQSERDPREGKSLSFKTLHALMQLPLNQFKRKERYFECVEGHTVAADTVVAGFTTSLPVPQGSEFLVSIESLQGRLRSHYRLRVSRGETSATFPVDDGESMAETLCRQLDHTLDEETVETELEDRGPVIMPGQLLRDFEVALANSDGLLDWKRASSSTI